ncbi:PBS lyase HEAT domain protein repeat-containing protein [Halorubrum californiense DSM 19288]|uniref:PBS lyase HEAT domain protein repeat-containing protein n=1 Tax=Halorubrum californiense DSM 19288 TaxID=1227465 RepID=M0EIA2_9EURY|nr:MULTISPECIES: HEAT repeat domain-containing protein [Halorubrum]ELZ46617.1 PBS lyase HEAT domain protein repeat-containing protein [Halorubrum californiense DSM 19288]TKX67341.1 HEAT repeat domain-containing protein [Halorubrum sp. GN11GM_10-3_MGM]
MSNGDDDPADASEEADAADDGGDAGEPTETAAPTLPDDATEESLNEYLDEIADRLEAAETEADLDDVEALLNDAETGIAEADLPEPDEDDEDADDPRGDLEDRVAELRDGVEDARGPYGEDVVEAIETAAGKIEETEWTDAGHEDVAAAVASFADAAADAIDDTLDAAEEDPEALLAADEGGEAAAVGAPSPVEQLTAALDAVAAAVGDADLDADEDAADIAALLEATDELETGLDDAEEWDDLETHEQLRAQGYYDVLGHYKDFPVEWAALKEHEAQGNVDMILLALDSLQSEFMERHCLEAFERMGKRGKTEASVEEILGRAEKRDQPAIRILGKMAAEEATDTLVEYVPEDSNPQLQKAVFKALGEIGAPEAVQPLADRLDPEGDDDELVRPHAARALGLIGDTRAVDPLADALEAHPSDDVRAAAGWALRQIGTREALEAVAEYADEHSFVVSTEGEKAREALDEAEPAPTA